MTERNGSRHPDIDHAYRSFACMVLRRAWKESGTDPDPTVVERFLAGEVAFAEVRANRERTKQGACAAGVVGVPRGIPGAAMQLAKWHACAEAGKDAADGVIEHVSLAAALRECGRDNRAAGPMWIRGRKALEGELERWMKR